ncbi:MAG: cation:proton antiporter [Pirellulaceae bacterium]
MGQTIPPTVPGCRATPILLYGLMVVATAAAFMAITGIGGQLTAPANAQSAVPLMKSAGGQASLAQLLLALIVLIVSCRCLGFVFRRLGQPPVIGEVIAGILLGPTLLGRVAPSALPYLLAPAAMPYLGMIAQLGIILYMFLIGLDFDIAALRSRGHAAAAISHASIIAPFILGALLALALYPVFSHDGVTFLVFALFLGMSMSVTAFPVLARILSDRGLHKTRLGAVALACAAMDDVTAWCLLALVIGIAQARLGAALGTLGLAGLYIAAMFLAVRPLLARLLPTGEGRVSQRAAALVLAALFVSAWITECIGIHAVFGAFLLGVIIPRQGALIREMREKLEDVVSIVLLPAFFAFAGIRTQIGLVSGAENWLWCGAIILVACLGKFGGSLVAARLGGMNWRDSAALGILMNTRGLMELIVLNIGLDLGLISPLLYTLMVIMALVTTMTTTPVLNLLGFKEVKSPQFVGIENVVAGHSECSAMQGQNG